MMAADGGHGIFKPEDKHMERSRWPVQAQECSMCGDVGFADQLNQCTRCTFRYQHTYCSNSTEGLRTRTWVCDWCRLAKDKSKDLQETAPPVGSTYSVLSEDSAGLECLLKAALCNSQQDVRSGGFGQTSSVDGGSLCSSSIESTKEDNGSFGAVEAPTCSSDDGRMSQGEEAISSAFPCGAAPLPRGHNGSDPKRNRKLMRSGTKISQKKKQKSPLDQQCCSVQLKRLSSMKGSKTGISGEQPKGFVRRYKSLSDISF